MIGSVRPYTVVSEQVIDKLARQCIRKHTALATTTSTIVGLPGGLTMAAALPADLVQYFYHVFVLSQKLAYLYGYPDFYAHYRFVAQGRFLRKGRDGKQACVYPEAQAE
jgi:hypothetical protein